MKQTTIIKAKLEIMEAIEREQDWNNEILNRITAEPEEYNDDYKNLVSAKATIYESLLNVLYKTDKWVV